MRAPIIDMQSLPELAGLHEYQGVIIHGGRYRVMMDGLDCYIYEFTNEKTMVMLVKLPGAELTEQLGIALLRAAALQRDAAKKTQ